MKKISITFNFKDKRLEEEYIRAIYKREYGINCKRRIPFTVRREK